MPPACLALLALWPYTSSSQGLLQPPQPGGFGALECLPVPANNASIDISPAGPPVTLETTGVYLRAAGSVEEGLYLGYAVRDGFTKILRAYRSTDAGGSWARLGDVESGDNRTRELDNAFPLVLPFGILYAYRNHDRSLNNTLNVPDNYTFYRLSVSASDDGGRSWSFLSNIDTRAANNGSANLNGLWEPFLRVAADGVTLQVFYSAENNAGDQDSLLRESDDGGLTWGVRRVVSGAERVRSRDGMVGVARLGDGEDEDDEERLILFFETTESGRFDVRRVLSPDDGRTWPTETRARVYDPLDEERQASAPAGAVNVGGTLVAGFMTNEGTNSSGTVPGDFKVVSSVDGGETWSESVLIAREAIWPGLYSLGRDRFLAMYSFDTHEGDYVAATRMFRVRRVDFKRRLIGIFT
ncbi:glycoside hydrolase family 93 protein [Diaporthe sp. PMI_573]|nr:glycoside hydrolase family 93 protein [Diaporthaceae sp. PMI_573]